MLSAPVQRVLLNVVPACNWTNGVGSAKLIPSAASPPKSAQINGLPDISQHQQQQQHIIAADGYLHCPPQKEGIFGIDRDPKLGPVEKAVLHQAMYNQSKKATPEMRRCDDCNVIFNSQNQAEMHYKGKKHAKVMFLKRTRETKRSSTKPSFSGAAVGGSNATFSTNIKSSANDLRSDEIGPKMESCDQVQTDDPTEYMSPAADGVTDNRMELPQEQTIHHILSPSGAINDGRIIDNSTTTESAIILSDDRSSPPTDEGDDINDDEGSALKAGNATSPREPVILPDPLPRYISRIEKPTVLKESLRCTVCDIYVNSENQMRQHVNSLRHKNIEKGIPTPPKPAKEDKPKGRSEQFRCEVCRVTLNSDIQLLQHLSSQRHRNMLEGKPPKPRWTPYERTQHALLRSAAHMRLSALKTISNGTNHILLSPQLSGQPLSLTPQGAIASPMMAQASNASHLKQMAYITPNGQILQAPEIVYIGAPPHGFPSHHQSQTPHQIPTTRTALIQSPFPSVSQDLSTLLSAPCVGLEHRELGFNWNAGI